MLNAFCAVIGRDLTLYRRRSGEWTMPILFFVMVVSVFSMALGWERAALSKSAPAIIWVAVVLALLMSVEGILRSEYQEGALEQLALSPYPLPVLILGKSIAHCIALGLPLMALAPICGLLLPISTSGITVLMMTLALGIPTVSLIGTIGAALTVTVEEGGALLAVLILPLMVPIVIFSTSGITAANAGLPFYAELLCLSALLLLTLALGPVAIAFVLRVSIE